MKMQISLGAIVIAIALVGCSESPSNYSKELSKEVPKPQEKGPDFGEFKPSHPLPGSKADTGNAGPKTITKGSK